MDSVEILVTCQKCGGENRVTIEQGGRAKPKCMKCNCVLMDYATVGGYIYILSNPRMKGLLKIGFSARPVQERIAELSSATGVPVPFELEAYFLSMDLEAHEQQIHSALAEHRVKGKEFFELQISKALQVAESVCKRPPDYLNPRIGPPPKKGGWDWGPGKPGSSAEMYDSNYEYKKRSGGF
jgi:hypothetical protein